MKKLLLAALVVVGTLSYGRDFEYGEKRDIQRIAAEQGEKLSRLTSKERKGGRKSENINFESYSSFHRELERADRGHERR